MHLALLIPLMWSEAVISFHHSRRAGFTLRVLPCLVVHKTALIGKNIISTGKRPTTHYHSSKLKYEAGLLIETWHLGITGASGLVTHIPIMWPVATSVLSLPFKVASA